MGVWPGCWVVWIFVHEKKMLERLGKQEVVTFTYTYLKTNTWFPKDVVCLDADCKNVVKPLGIAELNKSAIRF